MTTPAPILLTVGEAADLTRLSRAELYRRLRRGELPSVKIGKLRRIRPSDLERWAQSYLVTR